MSEESVPQIIVSTDDMSAAVNKLDEAERFYKMAGYVAFENDLIYFHRLHNHYGRCERHS